VILLSETEVSDLRIRIAVLETKDKVDQTRLNALEIEVGKKFDRFEAKLDQVLGSANGRPTWTISLLITGLVTIVTGLTAFVLTHI